VATSEVQNITRAVLPGRTSSPPTGCTGTGAVTATLAGGSASSWSVARAACPSRMSTAISERW
jgi:hypothetical protein